MPLRASLLICFLFTAVALAQPSNPQRDFKTMVWNNSHVVAYEKQGRNLTVTMEMIADQSDDRKAPRWQEHDFAAMRIDLNNNLLLDRNLDVVIGQAGLTDRICTSFLLSVSSTTPCGAFRSRASLKVSFASSPFHDAAHPVFRFSIPLDELGQHSKVIGFNFYFHSKGGGFAFYPAASNIGNSFKETIALNLDQL